MAVVCSAQATAMGGFLLVARSILRAASCVHSQCVQGRALLSFTEDNRALNAAVLRMQLDLEPASLLLLLADRAREPVVCACSLQRNQPNLTARTARLPSRD